MQLPLEENGREVAGLAAISRPLLVSTPDETVGLGSDLCPFRFHVQSRRPDAHDAFCSGEKRPRIHA
jgi:hypothetical protein